MHPDDLPSTLELLSSLGPDRSLEHEHRIRHQDQSYRWVHTEMRVVPALAGGFEVVGCCHDVSQRVQAEQSQRESEERFRQLVQHIDAVFWMIALDKPGLLYVSPAYERIWGHSCQSLYDDPGAWLKCVHPEDRERIQSSQSALIAQGDYDVIYRIIRPDGATRWIHDRAFQVRDASGKPYRMAGLAEDITRETELLEEIRRRAAERERIDRELEVARELQESILPRHLPEHPSFFLSARTRMAREVGGDFFDCFMLPAVGDCQRLGIAMADVAGKGVPAAMFTVLCRSVLKSLAMRGFDPALALQELNTLLCQDNDGGMFVTLFFGAFDVATGELRFCNGGHNPPWLLTPGDRARSLEATGLVLGVLPDASFVDYRVQLQPGQTLVLYTDGVTESRNPECQLFGEERMQKALEAAPGIRCR